MQPQPSIILLVMTSVLAVSLSIIPRPSLSQSSLNSSLDVPTPEMTCWDPVGFGKNLPDTEDCLAAALLLPRIGLQGVFHNDYPYNIFSLPMLETHKTCTVTVSISGSEKDVSAWTKIVVAVNRLAKDCSVGRFPIGKSAGVKYIGNKNHIRVTIEKLKLGISQGHGTNGTAIA